MAAGVWMLVVTGCGLWVRMGRYVCRGWGGSGYDCGAVDLQLLGVLDRKEEGQMVKSNG